MFGILRGSPTEREKPLYIQRPFSQDETPSKDEFNLGNVRSYSQNAFGSILFSPPYADVIRGKKYEPMATSIPRGWKNKEVRIDDGYSNDASNIGNITHFGSIIFSSHFGEANKGSGIAKKGYKGKHGKDENLKNRCDRPLSKDKKKIDNLRFCKMYFGEMIKVYRECLRVLKVGIDLCCFR